MDFTLRRAKPEDAGQIAHVHVAAWRTTYQGIVPQPYLDSLDVAARRQNWSEWLSGEPLPVFVAEGSNALYGFISGGPLREPVGDCDCELYALYVLAEAQRRGIGRRLMAALAGELAAQGFRRPAVWVLADNPSRHFYVRLGAMLIAEKHIDIGGVQLAEIAYGWERMNPLMDARQPATPR